jgi:predicted acyltransferase
MQNRLLSLDVFRGMTVAGMMIVNLPGNESVYPLLEHSTWNGCTIADLVFPFFIFIAGISLVFPLSTQLEKGISKKIIFFQIVKRACILFLLGLFLNAFPHFDLATLRIYGVLQRVAIAYLCAAGLFLSCNVRQQIIWMVGLLLGYWLTMSLIPVPGYSSMNFSAEGNVAAWCDRMLLSSNHLYGKFYDPEGFLSTFPAIATALLGNLTGIWLFSQHSKLEHVDNSSKLADFPRFMRRIQRILNYKPHVCSIQDRTGSREQVAGRRNLSCQQPLIKVQGMVFAGIVCMGLGWIWGLWFPINKALWTSSYVLWTGGIALNCLAGTYWLIEIRQWSRWSKPFDIFGMNALLAYVLHIFCLKIQLWISLPRSDGSRENIRYFITEHLFGWASLVNASLFYALGSMLCWLLVLTFLYRRRIFVKI